MVAGYSTDKGTWGIGGIGVIFDDEGGTSGEVISLIVTFKDINSLIM